MHLLVEVKQTAREGRGSITAERGEKVYAHIRQRAHRVWAFRVPAQGRAHQIRKFDFPAKSRKSKSRNIRAQCGRVVPVGGGDFEDHHKQGKRERRRRRRLGKRGREKE